MLDDGLHGGGHEHRQRWLLVCQRIQCRLRRKARVQGHSRANLQRRRGLDVQSANVKERQHGQDVILCRHVVHVLAHHGVPEQRLLAQHRAFRPASCAGGVDDQQRGREIDVRVAAVAGAGAEKIIE